MSIKQPANIPIVLSQARHQLDLWLSQQPNKRIRLPKEFWQRAVALAREHGQNKNMSNHINCSVLWQGCIYGFDGQVGGSGKLTCLDLATGEKKWSQDGMGTGSLMIADGKMIILGESGKLVIAEASPDGFKELASAEILTGKCWTVPVLANGRIYARNAAGQLVCVDVSG